MDRTYFHKKITSPPRWLMGIFFIIGCLILSACTTQDFEYAGKIKDVYRIKLKNPNDTDVKYFQKVIFYYIDGKDSLSLPDSSTIDPNNPEKLIVDSKKGAYGVKMDIRFEPRSVPMQLILEKGSGTGADFKADTVAKTINGKNTLFLRYGQVY